MLNDHMLATILHPPSSILSYLPFVHPLPIWDVWYLLLLPLAVAVAIVYKAIKLERVRDVPWQAAVITAWIVFGMLAAAIALGVIVKVVEM